MSISHDGLSETERNPEHPCMHIDGIFPYPTRISSSTAIILATTRSNINRAIELSTRGMVTSIIGKDPAYSEAPSDAFQKLDDSPGTHAVIVFSDQLTSSLDAPVLTSQRGQQRFLSLAESILNSTYGFRLVVSTYEGMFMLPPCSPLVSVLRIISNHLDSNAMLGGDWLVQELQTERHPSRRLIENRVRQRAFHSALMHMYWTHPDFNPERFDRIHGQLKSLYRASQPVKEFEDVRHESM
ncbi:hypothetical protein R1L06_18340 [Stenotrophomonas sp. C4297]|uniref:hypothetical protein n=1 Tax=Stenotrophomonas sp. C4297 TaxID=3077847 RepID=UPI00293C8541|nr:hypothetical protein [Stenotrophomonas sp. C4297]MDV3512688.1 hypothetical protein [Stenotrophomonas sp. C4297]